MDDADTFSPVVWLKEHKVKSGALCLGCMENVEAFKDFLSYVDSYMSCRLNGGEHLGSSTGTLEENAHCSRHTFNKYLLQAYCVPGNMLNPGNVK